MSEHTILEKILAEVQLLREEFRRGEFTLAANLKQLTEEIKNMSTSVLISAQALSDLQAADVSLQTAVANVLTYISTQLGTMPTDDTAQVEAVVSDIQAKIASLTAAITPATPPAATTPAEPAPTPESAPAAESAPAPTPGVIPAG